MPPPPPSQQGKFKPIKPAKRVRPPGAGASSSSQQPGADAPTAKSTSVGFAQGSSSSGGNYERGGGGRGRGGRDGRGRGRGGRMGGRAPTPSGKTFFTPGAVKPAAASKRKGGSALSSLSGRGESGRGAAGGGASSMREGDSTEEVVGHLETAIGAAHGDSKRSGYDKLFGDRKGDFDYDYGGEESQNDKLGRNLMALEGIFYDTDSSEEEERRNRRGQPSLLRPLELPFPTEKLPVGIGGGTERPLSYALPQSASQDIMMMEQELDVFTNDLPETAASPFVETTRPKDLAWEQDTWFLVQLPTRLPPLKPKNFATLNNNNINNPETVESSGDARGEVASTSNITRDESLPIDSSSFFADVVTPPVIEKSHDNVLNDTAAGRLGKMLVYKSGKTVLVMESADGSNEIRLNVNEGLTCGFSQEAVAIDIDEGKYVMLGDVKKSIVVTPDLESAFLDD